MPRLSWLADAARATGYPVTEVQGWESRGSATFNPRGLLWHHTAGAATGDMPSLNILINGRSGLPGPLSQYGLGRSGRIYVVAAGRANHAGSGGWNGLTGNGSVIGIEAEHVGKVPPGWPTVQLDAYRKLSAQILTRLNTTVDFMCGHKEWAPTRKIDPISLNMADERAHVGQLMTTPGEDDLETIIAALKAQSSAFYQRCQQVTGNPAGNAAWWGRDYVLQPGEPPPSDQEWRDAAPILLAAALELGVLFSGAPSLNDAQVRAIVLETGGEVFWPLGKPIVGRKA